MFVNSLILVFIVCDVFLLDRVLDLTLCDRLIFNAKLKRLTRDSTIASSDIVVSSSLGAELRRKERYQAELLANK